MLSSTSLRLLDGISKEIVSKDVTTVNCACSSAEKAALPGRFKRTTFKSAAFAAFASVKSKTIVKIYLYS